MPPTPNGAASAASAEESAEHAPAPDEQPAANEPAEDDHVTVGSEQSAVASPKAVKGQHADDEMPAVDTPWSSDVHYTELAQEHQREPSRRWVPTEKDKIYMEGVYSHISYPSLGKREELAARVKATERQVQVWFQNRRQREKVIDGGAKKARVAQGGAPSPDGSMAVSIAHTLACACAPSSPAPALPFPTRPQRRTHVISSRALSGAPRRAMM